MAGATKPTFCSKKTFYFCSFLLSIFNCLGLYRPADFFLQFLECRSKSFIFTAHFFDLKLIVNNHFKELNQQFYRQVSAAAATHAKQRQYEEAKYSRSINIHSRNIIPNYQQQQHQQQQKHNQRLSQLLKRFYHDYQWLLSLAISANSQVASRLFFTAIIANLPSNLVMIVELLFCQVPPLALSIFVLCLSFQINLVLLFAVLLTAISNSFYLSERQLYKVQLLLTTDKLAVSTENTKNRNGKQQQQPQQWRHFCHSSSYLLTKLHLAVFYETVCTKKKFRFTFGPHTKISNSNIFRFLLVYSGFIMYVAKMFKSGRL